MGSTCRHGGKSEINHYYISQDAERFEYPQVETGDTVIGHYYILVHLICAEVDRRQWRVQYGVAKRHHHERVGTIVH